MCRGCDKKSYFSKLTELKGYLKGEVAPVLEILRMQMSEFANRLQFEFAGLIKQKINTLEVFAQILLKVKDLDKLSFCIGKN